MKIMYITGTRADYGVMQSVLKEIEASPFLDLHLLVTGMHLMKEFGESYKEIEKSPYKYTILDAKYESDELSSSPLFISKVVEKSIPFIKKMNPDALLLLGDRAEMLAGAIVGQYLAIPVIHISGGDTSGHVDDSIRNAISKLSHLHFPSCDSSANKLLKMGEDESRIFTVGSTSFDNIKNLENKNDISSKYKFDDEYVLLLQHPVLGEFEDSQKQMRNTINALIKENKKTIIIYPNADAGGRKIINIIKEYENNSLITSYPNIPYEEFITLFKNASMIIGNSSAGIIESTLLKVPAINIGTRQTGRETCANILQTDYEEKDIIQAIRKASKKEFKDFCKTVISPYDKGGAAKKVVFILERLRYERLLNKNISQSILKPLFRNFNDLKELDFDYHMHTNQTDGRSTADEMINKAKENNLKSIAFTEHVNFENDWFDDFKKHILSRRMYEQMTIFIGIETKILDIEGTIDASEDIINKSDIVVGSVHRFPDGNGGLIPLNEVKKMGEAKAIETEYNLALSILKNKDVDVLGHPFGICTRENIPIPEEYIEKILLAAKRENKVVEIDTRYLMTKTFFNMLRKVNPLVSVGSDAHHVDEIGEGYKHVYEEIL